MIKRAILYKKWYKISSFCKKILLLHQLVGSEYGNHSFVLHNHLQVPHPPALSKRMSSLVFGIIPLKNQQFHQGLHFTSTTI